MITRLTSFPQYSTSFIGREVDSAELVTRVGTHRFVSLTGPGGVGKTRLISQCLPTLGRLFEHGATTVDALGLRTSTDLRARIADAVGVRDAESATEEMLIKALRGSRTLLVLDGCEGLDDGARLLIEELLASSGTLSILVSTRRALHLDGGLVLVLAPLTVPTAEYEPTGTSVQDIDIAQYDAVQLFVDRARLVRPQFELTPTIARSVATLCRRLDGLPLALELAASWVRALSVDQIIERMETSSDFPRAGTSYVAPRHRTLSSLVAGTFDLCTPEEQILWSRMSVFSESFDLTAVEGVCGGAPLDEADLLDIIAALVDQSVLVLDDTAGLSRYRLLRITREFGVTKLRNVEEIREEHRNHYDRVTTVCIDGLPGPREIEVFDRLRADYANITAAIEWGLRRPKSVTASARMATDLWSFWFSTGRLTEGRCILDRVVDSAALGTASVERQRALYLNSYLSLLQGDAPSARTLHRAASDPDGDVDVDTDDILSRGMELELAAMIGVALDNDQDSTAGLAEAISIYERGVDSRTSAMLLDAIGIAVLLAALSGNSSYAQDLGARGLAVSDTYKDVVWRAYIDYSLGVDAWLQRDFETARVRALSGLRASPDQLLVTHCVELLAWCASSRNDATLAARLFAAADRRWHQVGGNFSGFVGLSHHREHSLESVRHSLTREEFEGAYQSGYHMTVDDIAAVVTDLESPDSTYAADSSPDTSPLTSREYEVAMLLAEGLSNREIAKKLTISPRTAESHVNHILTKLDVPNRTQIVTWILGRRQDHPSVAHTHNTSANKNRHYC